MQCNIHVKLASFFSSETEYRIKKILRSNIPFAYT